MSKTATPPSTSTAHRSWRWLPTAIDSRVRVFAWLSFLSEVIIIGTGGAVRLSGSGLGCSQWPLCTPESLVPTPEQGYHGLIEFGNRTMTGVVGIVALALLLLILHVLGGRRAVIRALWFAVGGIVLAVFVYLGAVALGLPAAGLMSTALLLSVIAGAVDSLRRPMERKDLPSLAWIVLAGVMAQAVVGGFAVLSDLNPFIVGFHYASSLVLVCVTAAFLVRMAEPGGTRARAVPTWFAVLTHITGLALVVTIVFGVLTTGNGPHSGDAGVKRHGFDATVLAHVHAWPGYTLAALVLALTIAAWAMHLRPRAWLLTLVLAIAVQVGVGVLQARTGLPPVLVGIHMMLAALSSAAYTVVVLKLKRPADPGSSTVELRTPGIRD